MWSDRGIYRPGETLSFAGIDRDLVLGKFTPVQGKFRVDLVNGSDDSEPAASATGTVSASGSFSGQIVFPKDAEPGDWLLSFHRIAGKSDTRTGTARTCRSPISAGLPSPSTSASRRRGRSWATRWMRRFSGSYLAGGAVTKGKWSWFWTRRETWYQPPGDALADYTFGDVEKGWAEDMASDSGSLAGTGVTVASQKLSDGDKGRVYSLRGRRHGGGYRPAGDLEERLAAGLLLRADAGSQAHLRREIRGLAVLRDEGPALHSEGGLRGPGRKAVPLRRGAAAGSFARTGSSCASSPSGGMVDTRYEKEEVEEKTFTVKPGQPFGSVQLATQKSGSYAIELSGKDAKGRESFTRLTFYSTGSDEIVWQRSDERQLEIVPDKKIYAPGDTARLLIKSPLSKGTYLISVERDGVLEKRTLDLTGKRPDDRRAHHRRARSHRVRIRGRFHGKDKAARGRAGRARLRKAARILGARRDPRRDGLPHDHSEHLQREGQLPAGQRCHRHAEGAAERPAPARGPKSRWSPRTVESWTSSTTGSPTPSISSTVRAISRTRWPTSIRETSSWTR